MEIEATDIDTVDPEPVRRTATARRLPNRQLDRDETNKTNKVPGH